VRVPWTKVWPAIIRPTTRSVVAGLASSGATSVVATTNSTISATGPGRMPPADRWAMVPETIATAVSSPARVRRRVAPAVRSIRTS